MAKANLPWPCFFVFWVMHRKSTQSWGNQRANPQHVADVMGLEQALQTGSEIELS
jgi:hypothetical protein